MTPAEAKRMGEFAAKRIDGTATRNDDDQLAGFARIAAKVLQDPSDPVKMDIELGSRLFPREGETMLEALDRQLDQLDELECAVRATLAAANGGDGRNDLTAKEIVASWAPIIAKSFEQEP